MTSPLIELKDLVILFGGGKRFLASPKPVVRAVDGVSLNIHEGDILGLVGESGCGKSTLAKTILGIQPETSGSIKFEGNVVSGLSAFEARVARRDIQYVHQDPGAALDPWWRIGNTLHETLKINGEQDASVRKRLIGEMLEAVGLNSSFGNRYPHELSGGQQRRVGLARILILKPRVVILDEPTSGLDLSVQATVLKLISDLHSEFGLTYIFISHDLSIVERMCNKIAVMYLGRLAERGTSEIVFSSPTHPYTQALMAAVPRLEAGMINEMEILPGDPPSPTNVPEGCAFRNRCPRAVGSCADSRPEFKIIASDGAHGIACQQPWKEYQ